MRVPHVQDFVGRRLQLQRQLGGDVEHRGVDLGHQRLLRGPGANVVHLRDLAEGRLAAHPPLDGQLAPQPQVVGPEQDGRERGDSAIIPLAEKPGGPGRQVLAGGQRDGDAGARGVPQHDGGRQGQGAAEQERGASNDK